MCFRRTTKVDAPASHARFIYAEAETRRTVSEQSVNAVRMTTHGFVTLTLEAFPEGKTFVSRCRELGVASCGDSIWSAIEAVKDAVTTYINAIEALGERERVFAEKGIVIRQTKPRSVRVESDALPPNSFAGKVVFPLSHAA